MNDKAFFEELSECLLELFEIVNDTIVHVIRCKFHMKSEQQLFYEEYNEWARANGHNEIDIKSIMKGDYIE